MVLVGVDELGTLHKHTPAAAARVKHAAFVGFEHFDEELHHAGGRVKLAAFFAFSQSKLAQEVLEHPAKQVFALGFTGTQGSGSNEVHEAAEALLVQFFLSVGLRKYAAQRGVIFLDGIHGIVQVLTNGG